MFNYLAKRKYRQIRLEPVSGEVDNKDQFKQIQWSVTVYIRMMVYKKVSKTFLKPFWSLFNDKHDW